MDRLSAYHKYIFIHGPVYCGWGHKCKEYWKMGWSLCKVPAVQLKIPIQAMSIYA